ncbi:MSCRAMM family adhesin SdrC [Staphylococcus simulans]|nr:LPXTG cell wall anchor domain-containing protein [Staphylococcus simulans]MCD8915535.1 MSCRAMM family adhesin SdrC [Staphylococcus simulans]
MKEGKTETPSKGKEAKKELPETGQDGLNATLIGSAFAALGSILLFKRRKKNQ